ncbi:hypothetical protein JI58_08045 [Marinosulfonomonas sp. PRT-SC04]|nr:hypothetical protein JI58_08045 [Marinosulfonomonas sp. PRT-SC04]
MLMGSTNVPKWCVKGGSRSYVTAQTVFWNIGKKGSGWVLTIPPGREFESSVPKYLHWALSPDDPYFLKAAVIHDTLLESGFRRAFADSQWFEAAMSEHAPALRTWVAYGMMGVRRFWLWVVNHKRAEAKP